MPDDRHPCTRSGCDNTVEFDDEPYCFTHSPDSGSSMPGYSYKASQLDAEAWFEDEGGTISPEF